MHQQIDCVHSYHPHCARTICCNQISSLFVITLCGKLRMLPLASVQNVAENEQMVMMRWNASFRNCSANLITEILLRWARGEKWDAVRDEQECETAQMKWFEWGERRFVKIHCMHMVVQTRRCHKSQWISPLCLCVFSIRRSERSTSNLCQTFIIKMNFSLLKL